MIKYRLDAVPLHFIFTVYTPSVTLTIQAAVTVCQKLKQYIFSLSFGNFTVVPKNPSGQFAWTPCHGKTEGKLGKTRSMVKHTCKPLPSSGSVIFHGGQHTNQFSVMNCLPPLTNCNEDPSLIQKTWTFFKNSIWYISSPDNRNCLSVCVDCGKFKEYEITITLQNHIWLLMSLLYCIANQPNMSVLFKSGVHRFTKFFYQFLLVCIGSLPSLRLDLTFGTRLSDVCIFRLSGFSEVV